MLNEKFSFDSCLKWNGVSLVDLLKKHGSPLYVMNENQIKDNIYLIKNAAENVFKSTKILFASKACDFKDVYRICSDCGIGCDVVSLGEIYTAYQSGMNMNDVYFHGNSKTVEEIEFALKCNVGVLVIDNLEEIDRIQKEAIKQSKIQKVMVRITPGIDPHTYAAVSTGVVDCKFGCAITTGYALEVFERILTCDHLELVGFHCHIGSQVFDSEVFRKGSKVMLEFIAYLYQRFSFKTQQLNLGGGFGVPYVESDSTLNIDDVMKEIHDEVSSLCNTYNIEMPMILFEPGRSIVANAGVTLYTVNSVKKIVGGHNYVAIDGGMTDNPRYALYGSKYTVLCANKMNEEHVFKCTIAGKCCESGDIIARDVCLPESICVDDIIVVFTTGAYNYSMSSNYNRNLKPAVIMLEDDKDKVVVKRETLEDLLRNDI